MTGSRWVTHFGDEVKMARESAGFTSQREFGKVIGWSRSRIGDIESGRELPPKEFAEACDEHLLTNGLITRIWAHAKSEDAALRVSDLSRAEAEALAIRTYSPILVPGLLQTERYMRNQFDASRYSGATDADIDRLVDIRLRRQAVLSDVRSYLALLDEALLQRIMGGADIMAEQMNHLLALARSPRISIQVVPFESPAYPAAGPLTIFDLADGGQAVHLDGPVSGTTSSATGMVQACVDQFEMLRSQAASVPESVRMIQTRLKELR